MPGIGGTVWSGGFFSECDTDAVIALLHNRFDLHAGVLNSTKSCNGGSVVGQAIRVLSTNTKNVKYTSQLTVNVSSEMIGQNISCGYDNGVNVSFNVGSISLIGNQIQQGKLRHETCKKSDN